PLPVARIAVRVRRRRAKYARRTGFLVPAIHTVARDVAPDQAAPVAEPNRAFGPARAGIQPLDLREHQAILVERFVDRDDERVGVARAGLPVGAHFINPGSQRDRAGIYVTSSSA